MSIPKQRKSATAIFRWLEQVASDPSVSAETFVHAFWLTRYVNKETFDATGQMIAFPGNKLLAERSGVGERAVRWRTAALIEQGHVRLEQGGRGRGKLAQYVLIEKGMVPPSFTAPGKGDAGDQKRGHHAPEKRTPVTEKEDAGGNGNRLLELPRRTTTTTTEAADAAEGVVVAADCLGEKNPKPLPPHPWPASKRKTRDEIARAWEALDRETKRELLEAFEDLRKLYPRPSEPHPEPLYLFAHVGHHLGFNLFLAADLYKDRVLAAGLEENEMLPLREWLERCYWWPGKLIPDGLDEDFEDDPPGFTRWWEECPHGKQERRDEAAI
jgi:hypothetical protein